MAYGYNGILLRHEKEGNPAICDNMDGHWRHMLSEMSDRKRQILYNVTHM